MKKTICILIILSMIFTCNLSTYAADSVSNLKVPDFESYCLASGVSLDKHPYYFIHAYASGGYLVYACIFSSSNIVYIQNSDTSGGSWSTKYYSGYTTQTDFIRVNVQCDFDSNYISHTIATDNQVGTKHFYIDVNAKNLHSNHNIIMKNTNNSVSTFSSTSPFLTGEAGNYWYEHISPTASSSSDDTNNKLSGIIDWLSDIGNWITSGFNNVITAIQNIVSNITSLPSRIWDAIQTGLINLFVPDDEYIKNIKVNWETLLSSRFGAVYQSFNFLIDFVKGFTVKEASSTVHFPSVTVNLVGEDFTFGGYDVQLVPEGFTNIVNILKGLTSLVCTIAFINIMNIKLKSLLGGKEG